MPVLRLIFFWVFSLILSFNSLANDQEKFRFSLIDINQGLSNNQVKCFLKDSRGFLWIGTASGLNRYDGYAMKVFKYSSGDTSSITSNDVLKLMEDPQGEIWVRTSQGLCVFDPSTEKFTRNLQSLIKQYRLPANASIEEIVKDKAGNYWFVTLGQGLLKYNPKNRTSVRLQHAISAKNSLSTNHISAMGVTKGGLIWLVHQNGILEKVDPNTLQVLERNDEIYRTYTQQLLDYALTVDSQGDLWVYAREQEGGVFFYETGSRTLHHFHKNSSKLQLSNNLTRGIVEGEKGQIWIGTDHGGINVIDKKNLTVTYIRHNNEQKKSIAHNSINALYKDQEGIIWIGTFKKGVNFYHKNIFRFVTVMQHVPAKGGLPFEDVNAFAEDAQGNLWIGTNGGGLLYWNRTTGAYTRYLYDPKNPKSLSSDVIVSLLIDRQQRLWVGTYLGGLNRFENGTFIRYKNVPGDKTSLSDNSVWELFEDQTGNLWIGTLRGGLALLDPKQKEFVASGVDGGKYPVHCNYISSIAQDRHGNMWVGGGYGLDMFHQKTGKSTFFLHDPKNPRSLVSNNITALYKDRKRNIWIGTAEGLDLYQEEDGTFAHFTTKDGLPSNTIVSIKEDKNGNLWLSTQNGLSNLVITETTKGKTYSFRNYDELDGLQGKAFNENSAYSTRKGEMIFGGPNGFNIFYPDRIEKNTVAPKVVFTDFQLFNKSLQLHQPYNGRELLTRSISETQRLTLEHDENVFSIEFAALNYYHPEKNRYRYQLKGFDTNWQTVDGRNRRVTYTNLDPGEYVFTVLASNNDGVWNETGATLNITVLAPFWRTTTAYVLYFLFAVLALVILRRVELRRAKFKFILEQKEREARQLHELDLMKIKFFTNVSHEFRTPLTLILAPIEELLKAGAHQDLQPQFQMINKNARRLLNMVNQLLDFKKVYDQDISLTLSDGNVVAFVQDAVNSFMELSDKKHVSLHFTSSVREFFTSFDKDKLEKVLFNLLSNAFKFTPENGRIGVSLQCHESDSSSEGIQILEIKVKDTGIGIAKENHQKIFERFFREQVPSYLMNQGSGIGLALANEFVQLHGGLIAVESVPNQGSCFTVTIPVRQLRSYAVSTLQEEAFLPQQEQTLEPVAAAEVKPQVAWPAEKKPVVLVVEDNEDFRYYLKDSLLPYFQVLEAKDGKEGWQKALSHLPDLVVSDLMMPELNGMEFCKKIKADPRTSQIPFVLLTAHASEEKQLKGLGLGANDYLTKPFHFELLLTRLQNLITQRELLQKVFEKKISVQTSENQIVSLDDKLVQKAIKFVEENLSNPDLTVEEMSRELGLSRVHLYKKLVAITGQSPVEFIRKIRLQHAAQFLEKSQLTVAEVAYKVGFNNRKYFSKYFKDEYNILPSHYAMNKQAEAKEV